MGVSKNLEAILVGEGVGKHLIANLVNVAKNLKTIRVEAGNNFEANLAEAG